MDYLIEGIPVPSIRHQAMMQRLENKEELLRALENISLRTDTKLLNKNDKYSSIRTGIKIPTTVKKAEVDTGIKQVPRCFNCNTAGHVAVKCPQPRRERGACFRCFQVGHKAKDCTSQGDQSKENMEPNKITVNSVFEKDENFIRNLHYQFRNDEKRCEVECDLDTLLDTSSPVSFVKDSFVPDCLIGPIQERDTYYGGLNGSELKARGRVMANFALNDKEYQYASLLVVPATTMAASVVMGRDLLLQLYNSGLTNETAENRVIREILNIDMSSANHEKENNLNVNPELFVGIQSAAARLYEEEYIKPIRPDEPEVKAELKLTLKEQKTFHFSPRRLSHSEKSNLRILLDTLLDKEIIRVSESEYASPIILIRKKTGDIRLCVDFRELNKLLVKDNFPLPNIEDLIDSLHEKKYFSLLDLKNTYI